MANQVTLTFSGDSRDLERVLARIGDSTRDAADEVEKSSSRMGDAMGKIGSGLQTAGLAAGAAAGAAITAGLMSAVEQEATVDKLAARLGLSPAEHERLGGLAGDLYASAYGESLDEVSLAVETVYGSIEGMATASDEVLRDATETALNFASAFDIDVAAAARSAGQAVKSGLAADAEEAFDLMTAAAQRTAPDLREAVLDAANEYGQFFTSIGIDGPQAFGMLAEASQSGAEVLDKVGDSLKEFGIIMTTSNVDQLGPVFASMGLDFATLQAEFAKGGDASEAAFQQIVGGLESIADPLAQQQAAIQLFGTPLEDLGRDSIPAFLGSLSQGTDALGDFSTASDDMGAALNDNASTSLKTFQRSMEQALVEKLAEALPTIEKVANWLIKYADYIVPIVAGLAAFAAAVGVVSLAMQAYTVVQGIANVVMMANPIGLIIVAIGLLVAAIVLIATKTTWFQDAWRVSWDWIQRTAGAAADWIGRKWDEMIGWITGLPARIRSAASGMWDGIKDAFRNALNWIIDRWNGLGFTLPSITVFGQTIGGGRISTPDLPRFHSGGIVPGAPGTEVPILAMAGERVDPIRAVGGSDRIGSDPIVLRSGGSALDDLLVEVLGRALRTRGVRVEGWTI